MSIQRQDQQLSSKIASKEVIMVPHCNDMAQSILINIQSYQF